MNYKNFIRDFNPIDEAKDAGKKVAEAAGKKVDEAKDAGKKVAEDVGKKAGDFAEDAEREILKKLFEAFDNFRPKKSTSYSSGLLVKPIIVATILNIFALILLIFVNHDNYVIFYLISNIFLITATILLLFTLVSILALFSLVFDILSSFPGIENNTIGPAILLLICSILFLIIALIVTIARCYGCIGIKSKTLNIRF